MDTFQTSVMTNILNDHMATLTREQATTFADHFLRIAPPPEEAKLLFFKIASGGLERSALVTVFMEEMSQATW